MNVSLLKIILSIISLLLPIITESIGYMITQSIKKKKIRAEVMMVLQEIQYLANVYHANFYTLENNTKPFKTLMGKIGYAVMFVETISNSLDRHTYEKTMNYLIATRNNLLFSVDRLKGSVRYGGWRILPDIEQQYGDVFTLYWEAQKALRGHAWHKVNN